MNKNTSFESAYEKLEEINQKLEEGTESLENSIKLYKQGTEIANYCEKILANAEQEIEVLES